MVLLIACRYAREVLDIAGQAVKPGVTTEEIDERKHVSNPLAFHASLLTSVGLDDGHGLFAIDVISKISCPFHVW
jgi:hypothetical protein